jgi:hypothetical protein
LNDFLKDALLDQNPDNLFIDFVIVSFAFLTSFLEFSRLDVRESFALCHVREQVNDHGTPLIHV